jgi:hypothetical protein
MGGRVDLLDVQLEVQVDAIDQFPLAGDAAASEHAARHFTER